jgi:hypothetical protein
MSTTYYLESADELNSDLLESIKAAYKSKPITITIEEDEAYVELDDNMKAILDERLEEDESTYLSGETSINLLKKKYGL